MVSLLLSRVCTTTTAILLTASLARAQSPIIDLGYAQYQGAVNTANNITHFLGLRVYYPSNGAGAPPENLPTVVWIHGGGYLGGAANSFNGEDIIRQSNRGVVVVIIAYHLGVFGFLPGSAVKQNGDLNAGLLDQDFALRWVNQHISKFGGDPTKVTIWGESAGAGLVLQHVIANDGQTEPQLFRAAITSSTFLPSQYQYNDRVPELLFNKVLTQANCTTATESMACLRAADATVLEAANNNISLGGFFHTFLFVPVVDGVFITQRPTVALMESKVNGEALLAVTNTFEGATFVDHSVKNVSAAQYLSKLFPDFSTAQANTVASLYADVGDRLFQDIAVQGESIFICPTYYLLNAFPGRSFKGEFAIPPGQHGKDLVYYFPGNSTPPFNNTAFINAFAQLFTSFIVNLDPNVKINPTTITPQWNMFDVQNTEMLFNQTAPNGLPVVEPRVTSDSLLERCRFWDSVGMLSETSSSTNANLALNQPHALTPHVYSKEVKKAIHASVTVTPIENYLVKYDLRDRLRNATDATLERYLRSGEIWLRVSFMHTLFLEPTGKRPLGHFTAVETVVFSRETCSLLMKQADTLLDTTNGFEATLFWFRRVFLPVIAAADTAYITHSNAFEMNGEAGSTAPHSKLGEKDEVSLKRYGLAQGLLTTPPPFGAPAQAPSNDLNSTGPTRVCSETARLGATVHKAILGVASALKQECDTFVQTAFPSGVWAFVAEAPTAFATGFLSAFRSEAPRGIKRKLIHQDEADYSAPSSLCLRPAKNAQASRALKLHVQLAYCSLLSEAAYHSWSSLKVLFFCVSAPNLHTWPAQRHVQPTPAPTNTTNTTTSSIFPPNNY
ncbi:Alpha/Beta hydrolase protein [Mycena capillaripes]|nr:Alpha/Beta hydrolase protein [Mycena capillaripes]